MLERRLTFSKFVTCWLALIYMSACKKPAVERSHGYIVGDSNDMSIYRPEDANKTQRDAFKSSVLVSTLLVTKKRKFCSGSLISTDGSGDASSLRILTNFHCFASTNEDGKVSEAFLAEACVNTTVYFNFTKDAPDKAIELTCKEESLTGDFTGDLALFELNGAVPENARPLELWSEETVPNDRSAFLIHHPDVTDNFSSVGQHPFSLPAAAITRENCHTMGHFPEDEWPLDATLPFSFKHSCDLQHGSSGSALIDELTGHLLGVNWGGIEIKYKDRKEIVNAATSAYFVKAFLNGTTEQIVASSKGKEADAEKRKKAEADKKNSLKAIAAGCGVIAIPTNSASPLAYWLILMVIPLIMTHGIRLKR